MNQQKTLGKTLIAIGLVSLIFAIVCFSLSVGEEEWFKSYGGDAYTGIQNASAQTANNITNTNTILKTMGGFLFVIIGASFIAIGSFYLSYYTDDKDKNTIDENESETTDSNTPTTDAEISEETHSDIAQ